MIIQQQSRDWIGKRQSVKGLRLILVIGLVAALVMVVLVSCGEPEPTPPPPETLIQEAGRRMAELPGFAFQIETSGQPIPLDPDGLLALGSTTGFYTAPDKALGEVTVLAPGLVTKVNLISTGNEQWITNLLTGDWMSLPSEWGFDPAVLFDANNGFLALVTRDLLNLSLEGLEETPDKPGEALYVVTGTLDGTNIGELSLGLLGPEALAIKLWIHPETFELHRIEVRDPAGAAEEESSVWLIMINRHGETVNIQPPEIDSN